MSHGLTVPTATRLFVVSTSHLRKRKLSASRIWRHTSAKVALPKETRMAKATLLTQLAGAAPRMADAIPIMFSGLALSELVRTITAFTRNIT